MDKKKSIFKHARKGQQARAFYERSVKRWKNRNKDSQNAEDRSWLVQKGRQIVNDLCSLKVDPLRRELQSLESAAKVKSEEAEKMTKLISTLENRLVIRSSCYTILSFSSLFLYNIRTMCSSRSI